MPKPDFSNLHVFGCLAYSCTINSGRKKLESRSSKCIFVGFKQGTKGYVLYSLENHNLLCLEMFGSMRSNFLFLLQQEILSLIQVQLQSTLGI
jgi:hypothetical protein